MNNNRLCIISNYITYKVPNTGGNMQHQHQPFNTTWIQTHADDKLVTHRRTDGRKVSRGRVFGAARRKEWRGVGSIE